MRRVIKLAALIAAFGLSAPAAAEVGDRTWAQCVWETAPQSAASWLAMEMPEYRDNLALPRERLGFRLFALCNETAIDPLRPNHSPNWRRLRSRLEGSRPSAAGELDAAQSRVELCQNFALEDGQRLLYLIDIVRVSGSERNVRFQQYFVGDPAGNMRLPQDLRALPELPTEIECNSIESDGSLTDA